MGRDLLIGSLFSGFAVIGCLMRTLDLGLLAECAVLMFLEVTVLNLFSLLNVLIFVST